MRDARSAKISRQRLQKKKGISRETSCQTMFTGETKISALESKNRKGMAET